MLPIAETGLALARKNCSVFSLELLRCQTLELSASARPYRTRLYRVPVYGVSRYR